MLLPQALQTISAWLFWESSCSLGIIVLTEAILHYTSSILKARVHGLIFNDCIRLHLNFWDFAWSYSLGPNMSKPHLWTWKQARVTIIQEQVKHLQADLRGSIETLNPSKLAEAAGMPWVCLQFQNHLIRGRSNLPNVISIPITGSKEKQRLFQTPKMYENVVFILANTLLMPVDLHFSLLCSWLFCQNDQLHPLPPPAWSAIPG